MKASPAATRRSRRARAALTFGLPLATVAALGLLVGVASTGVPYLSDGPSTDAALGPLNHCLALLLERPRLGWAVSHEGGQVAGFDARTVARCGPGGARRKWARPGVTHAAFDGEGTLWIAADGELSRMDAAEQGFESVGAFRPLALAGHARGIVALDGAGHLVSLDASGAVLGSQELASVPRGTPQLSVGPGGEVGALVLQGGVLAFETSTLAPLRLATPCAVDALWWTDAPDRVVVGCGGHPPTALRLGLRDEAPPTPAPRPSRPLVRLPGRPLFVHDCEGLPCSAELR